MASGLSGVFGCSYAWGVEPIESANVCYRNTERERISFSYRKEDPLIVNNCKRESHFNTIHMLHDANPPSLVFAAGTQMNLLCTISLSELYAASMECATSSAKMTSKRSMQLSAPILNITSTGRSPYKSEVFVLALTESHLYHLVTKVISVEEELSQIILRVINTINLRGAVPYAFSVSPNAQIARAAIITSGSSQSGDILRVWDPSSGLHSRSIVDMAANTESFIHSSDNIPLPSAQCSHHPQVVNFSWLCSLRVQDHRQRGTAVLYESKGSYIAETSCFLNCNAIGEGHNFNNGINENHVFVSRTDRKAVLLDVRKSNTPLATRICPVEGPRMMQLYSSTPFSSVSNSSFRQSTFFLGTSRYSPVIQLHSVSVNDPTTESDTTMHQKASFYNSCSIFGAVSSLSFTV